jgi:thioredoxin reductase (NADPH)
MQIMKKMVLPESVYDVVIVGGGPGGLTAGLYASRAGLKTLLIEGATSVSQITVTDIIENYPGMPDGINGFELVERFKKQAAAFGVQFMSADVTAFEKTSWGAVEGWRIAAGDKVFEALAVIVSTGAHWRRLGVPGEEGFIGRGVSFCATCDGPFYRGKEVVVVGGGNTAIQEALFLTTFASKVTVVHRRDRLRADAVLQKRAMDNGRIEFAWDSVVEEVAGRDFVEGVRIRDVKSPEKKRTVPAEGVFIFIGLIPNTDLLRGVAGLSDAGYVVVDSGMRTSAKGIFACGDCIDKTLRQVVTACGDGATAAYSAQLYVESLKGESY